MKIIEKRLDQIRPYENNPRHNDETVGGVPYSTIVDTARRFISGLGGFEKFAEWGLV